MANISQVLSFSNQQCGFLYLSNVQPASGVASVAVWQPSSVAAHTATIDLPPIPSVSGFLSPFYSWVGFQILSSNHEPWFKYCMEDMSVLSVILSSSETVYFQENQFSFSGQDILTQALIRVFQLVHRRGALCVCVIMFVTRVLHRTNLLRMAFARSDGLTSHHKQCVCPRFSPIMSNGAPSFSTEWTTIWCF